MTTSRPHVTVAALDSSEMAPLVLEHALAHAAGRPSAELHVLGVVDTGRQLLKRQPHPTQELEQTELRLRMLVEEAVSSFAPPAAGLSIRVHARAGVPDEQIIELAGEARAQMIVLGRHGERGRRRFFLGSVPERVARAARCPVYIVQVPDYGTDEASRAQCEACVALRRESGGESWFCAEHTSELPWRSSTLRLPENIPLRNQGLWF